MEKGTYIYLHLWIIDTCFIYLFIFLRNAFSFVHCIKKTYFIFISLSTFINNVPFEQHLIDANPQKILSINLLLLINSFVNNCRMSIFPLSLRWKRLISLFVRWRSRTKNPLWPRSIILRCGQCCISNIFIPDDLFPVASFF